MEVMTLFAAKAHFKSAVVGGAAAGAATAAGAHISGQAGAHTAAYILTHGSSNIAIHVGVNGIHLSQLREPHSLQPTLS